MTPYMEFYSYIRCPSINSDPLVQGGTAVELESFVFGVSLLLEIIAAASVAAGVFLRSTRWAMNAEVVLIGCLCGLGSVTVIGAMLRMAAGLVSGIAFVLVGVAVIALSERGMEEEPLLPRRAPGHPH